jgi:hypothetical protein
MNAKRLFEVRSKIRAQLDRRIRTVEQAIGTHRHHVDQFEFFCSKECVEYAEAHLTDAYRLEAFILATYGEIAILRRALECDHVEKA